MYVAVKGGEKAIAHAHQLQADLRRGDRAVAELGCDQVAQQLGLAVDRVMTEGGICDPELAALAIKQASGDLVEAIFLLREDRLLEELLIGAFDDDHLPRRAFYHVHPSQKRIDKNRTG